MFVSMCELVLGSNKTPAVALSSLTERVQTGWGGEPSAVSSSRLGRVKPGSDPRPSGRTKEGCWVELRGHVTHE